MKGVKFGGLHSCDEWGLILSEKELKSPDTKTYTVELEGGNGVLDFTEFFGAVKYENRKLTFKFIKPQIVPDGFLTLYSLVQDTLHGKKMQVILDDDPAYFYYGRVSVNEWKSNKGIGEIVIEVDAEPYKYKKDLTRQLVNLSGRNLIDNYNIETLVQGGTTLERLEIGIRARVAVAGTYKFSVIKVAPSAVLVGQKITASFIAAASADNEPMVQMGYQDPVNGLQSMARSGITGTKDSISMTVTEEMAAKYKYVVLYLYSNLTGTAVVGDYVNYTNLQVEIGEKSDYEAYDSGESVVKINAANSRMPTVPIVIASKGGTIATETYTKAIETEQSYEIPEMELKQGDNELTVSGTGLVLISYQEGRL